MDTEKQKIIRACYFPGVFVLLIWFIKYIEVFYKISFAEFGITPRSINGLTGVILAPLLHSDMKHISANTLPLLVLGVCLYYFYNSIATRVFFLGWFISGFWIWMGARNGTHIGASILIYNLGSFLFFSGIFSKNIRLLAISLFVTFMYGSLFWGMFPMDITVSWEGHLMGALAGCVLAIYYLPNIPKPQMPDWYYEDDNDEMN